MFSRTIRTRLLAVMGALVTLGLLLMGAAPATAHGGEILLDINQDGLGRVMVTATYAEDGHPVEEIIDPVLTAMSADGTIVGPIRLISASDMGFATWSTAEPLLAAGVWTVTVTTTTPVAATLTEDIEIAIVDTTEPEPAPVEGSAEALPWWIFLILGVVLLVLLAVVIVVVTRMRSRRGIAPRH